MAWGRCRWSPGERVEEEAGRVYQWGGMSAFPFGTDTAGTSAGEGGGEGPQDLPESAAL